MEYIHLHTITTDQISLPLFTSKKVDVDVLRLDRIDPVISGNKWFKLRFYLDDAIRLNKKTIITFGGAWSNHIIATAALSRAYDLQSIGIIRGEEPMGLSSTLQQARSMGMRLMFISREDYQEKRIPESLVTDNCYVINEGGYGIKGAEGAATILEHCNENDYSHICCACGTGTMTAGLLIGSKETIKIIGLSVLKYNPAIKENINSLLPSEHKGFTIIHDYHFGGYAKFKPELIRFMNEFYRQTSIPSDFVYIGKLFYAIHDLVATDHFPVGSRLLIIHSGGLQGNDSLNKGTLIF
jgi:1-aminocyclopropane-1-carboxylate deaminase